MSYSVHPLAAALAKAVSLIGSVQWVPNSGKQMELLDITWNIDEHDFRDLSMETIASYSADEINAFLAQNGFDIKLNGLSGNEFGVASILKILMTWSESAEHQIHAKNGSAYQGVKITENIRLLDSVYSMGYVAEITSKEGFKIYFATPPKPADEQALFAAAKKMSEEKNYVVPATLKSVIFPEVEMDYMPDISWLIGMRAGKNTVTQAVMQTKFKLDKTGAKAEAAAAIGVRKAFITANNNLVFDQPFMAWIEKPGIDLPVFVAWCEYDSWTPITR
jgi:hypothetical protein